MKRSKALHLGSTIKNAARLKTIMSVFAKYGFESFAEKIRFGRFLLRKISSQDVLSYSTEERLRMCFEELGPAFIKLGQLLATRPDLIPNSFCEEFKKLHSEVNPLNFSEMENVLIEHYGKDYENLFISIDPDPLGTASIAQVHKAQLKSGEDVVLKILKPQVVKLIYEDLGVLYNLAELIERYIPEAKLYNPVGIVDEFFKTLELEVNFIVEANNIRRIKENFKNWEDLVIPRVYLNYSCEKVLVLEMLKGFPLSQKNAIEQMGADPEKIIKTGLKCYFQMVFKDGFFHGDMHPGNIFVLPNNKMGLIDFGVVGRLNQKTKTAIANMLVALTTEDYDRLAYEYVDLAPYSEHVDVDRLSRQIRDLLSPFHGLNLEDVNTGKLLLQTTNIAGQNQLVLPSELVLFFKSIVSVEGIGHLLKKDFNVLPYALEFAGDLIQTKYDPGQLVKDLSGVARDANRLIVNLPRQTRQILRKLNSPDFSHRVEIKELYNIKRTLVGSAKLIFTGLVISSLVISASFLLTQPANNVIIGVPSSSFSLYILATILFFLSFIRRGG